jgi:biopolymer transport protein ExbD
VRVPSAAKIGVALIVSGIAAYLGETGYVASRTWVPLDIPVSLSRGQIRTDEFKINVESSYWIYVEVERKFDFDDVPCLLGQGFDECKTTPSVLRASWTLTDEGKAVAQGTSDEDQGMLGGTRTMGRGLGSFNAAKGQHYVLTVNVLEDGSLLNAGNPRLKIEEQGGAYWKSKSRTENLFVLAILLGIAGATILIRSVGAQRRSRDWRTWSLTEPGPSRRELQPAPKSGTLALDAPQTIRKRWRLPGSAWLGIGLVFLGFALYAGIRNWMGTLIFVPVNMPVSLAPGHIKTGPFRINLKGWYTIWIDFGQPWQSPNCYSYSVLKTRWALSRDGRVTQESGEPAIRDSFLEFFQADKGTYDLDVTVLADASCLNANRPRLRIVTSESPYSELATLSGSFALLCAAAGLSLLVLLIFEQLQGRSRLASVYSLSDRTGPAFRWTPKYQLRRPFSELPHFALLAVMVFFVAWMPFTFIGHLTSFGLKVHLATPPALLKRSKLMNRRITVRVDYDRKLYVNSVPVELSELEVQLRKELSLCPGCVVNVEGDPSLQWQDVAHAIDVARGIPAEVVIVTTESKSTSEP